MGRRIWEIDWYQKEWPWSLFRSYQGHVNHIRRWISRKPLEIESWLQRTTNRKWLMGYTCTNVQWSRDRWRHVTPKVKLVTLIRLERNISKTAGDRDSVPKNYQ